MRRKNQPGLTVTMVKAATDAPEKAAQLERIRF